MASDKFRTITSYQKGAFPFPKDEIPTSEKGGDWCRQFCEAMYASWVTDKTGVPFSTVKEMQNLRRYGEGKQDISKYQNILVGAEEEGAELKGYLNIDWEIFSVMPKFKHIIRGMFEDQDHSIVATAIDPKSIDQKETEKLKKWFKARYRPIIENINKMAGAQPEEEWLPESVDELEFYQSVGGFKLAKEMEIEEALDYTLYISDFKETKRKMIDDFADINCAAIKDYTDQYTRKSKIRYVDPVKLIMQYSRHWDHRNAEYAGELIQESISNVRKNTELTEEQLRNLAQTYNGRNLNQNLPSWGNDETYLSDTGTWTYDNFMIDVMDAEWFSVNQKNFTTRKNERGESLTYEENSDKVYNTEKKKTKTTKYKTVYRAKWIVGTDYVYDFGLQYDIVRPGKKEVELSYKFYKLPGRSLVSSAVPNLDQMQLTWLKLQNAIAMASNAGIAIDYTAISNMSLGGKKLDPLEILTIRRETGDLIYKTTTHAGKPNVNGGMRPVQEMVGGIGPQLSEYMILFERNLEFIRELTGINRITDASSPNPNDSVGGSEMAISATNNALKPIYAGYIRLKELVARSSAIRIQILMKHDKKAYEGMIPVIGGTGVKILSVGVDAIDADFSIKIQAKPTQQRKQLILQAAMQAMRPDKDGTIGIEQQDFMMIERLLEAGDEKQAEVMLTVLSNKNKEKQKNLQRENMTLNSERSIKEAQVKGEELRKTKEFESQLVMQQDKNKADLEARNDAKKHQQAMELKALEKTLDANLNKGNSNKESKKSA